MKMQRMFLTLNVKALYVPAMDAFVNGCSSNKTPPAEVWNEE